MLWKIKPRLLVLIFWKHHHRSHSYSRGYWDNVTSTQMRERVWLNKHVMTTWIENNKALRYTAFAALDKFTINHAALIFTNITFKTKSQYTKENVTIPIRASNIVTHLRSQLTKSLGTDSHYSNGLRALTSHQTPSPCSDETGAGQDNMLRWIKGNTRF